MPKVREAGRPPSPWDSLAMSQPLVQSKGAQGLLDALALSTMPVPVVGDVAGLASDAYRFATDPESRTLGNAAWASLGMLPFVPYMGAIRAYHGSGQKFDKFDMSRIGTGEGTQAYGHGIYFAENPAVAQSYKDLVGARRGAGAQDVAARILSATGGDVERAIETVNQRRKISNMEGAKEHWDSVESIIRGEDPRGSLYTVDLDVEPEDLLDWEAPLSQQSEKVRRAVEPLAQKMATPTAYHRDRGIQPTPVDEMTGAQLYHALARREPAAASSAFRAAGIPGVRYLDAGSREAGEGTRNFVLFDEALAKILERNGQPVAGK